MGNRSYLYLKNKKRAIHLFEANNSLPFFWISLLDRQTLKNSLQDWKKSNLFQESHSEEETEIYLANYPSEISINEKTFLSNSAKGRTFLQNHFPKTTPLFNDFVDFIKSKFNHDDYLKVDIVEFSAFYNSINELYNAIDNDLEAIETNNPTKIKFLFVEDLISSGTGFIVTKPKEATDLSNYQAAFKTRTSPKIIDKQEFSKKALIIYILMLIICPLFSIIAYKMYQDYGFTFSITLLMLINIGFYIASIYGIKAEIRTYIAQKN